MKKNILYLAALAMLTAACSNEEDNVLSGDKSNVKMITETITATSGDGSTRADIAADASFTWTAGDQIAVHVSDGKYYTTTALASGGSNTAEFSVTYPDGQTRDCFAVYPASLVPVQSSSYGMGDMPLAVTLPNSYTIAQVSGTTTPCPMIATNTAGSWTFKQLCGMLRLTVNNIPTTATYLKIDFNGKKVQGDFTTASPVTPGTSTIETSATASTDDIITITGLNGAETSYDINLPLPTGDYTNVTVTAYNSYDAAILSITRPLKASGTYTAARAKGRKVTATLPVFTVNSSNKKVAFSKGNLQAKWNGSTWSWAFAEHQWDYIGDAPGNTSINGDGTVSTNNVTVDLFGWVGASNTTWPGELGAAGIAALHGITNSITVNSIYTYGSSGSEALKSDWGTLPITNGGNTANSGWHTLSTWYYLFERRTVNGGNGNGYSYSYTKGQSVNGVAGIVIYPDDYTGSVYAGSDWATFEAAGCVFLPAAGWRNGSTVGFAGSKCCYWTSSTYYSTNDVYCLELTEYGSVSPNNWYERKYGCSVRLVYDVN